MKFTSNTKDLEKTLQVGGMFAGTNKLNAMHYCVKLKVANDALSVISTNSENSISKKLQCVEADEDFSICVTFSDIMPYVKSINSEKVEVSVSDDKKTLSVKHDNGSIMIPAYDDKDFSTMPIEQDTTEFVIDSEVLFKWLTEGALFVSSDSSIRPVLEGIHFEFSNGRAKACSSDGLIAYISMQNTDFQENKEFTLNSATFNAVKDIISNAEKVKVRVGEKNVMFVCGGASVVSRLIEGRYPNVERVFPENVGTEIRIGRKQIVQAINRVKMASSESSLVVFAFSEGLLKITSQNSDMNKTSEEILSVENEKPFKIGFNYKNLIRALSACQGDEILFGILDPGKPCVVKESDSESDKKILVMPMMI